MELGELSHMAEEQNELERDKWIGVYIGVLAVLLALCAMGGSNATKEAARYNIEASNMWAFFQAKNERRTQFIIAADDLDMRLKADASLTPPLREAMEARAKTYRTGIAQLSSDPVKKEGLDELFEKAKKLEEKRDENLKRDPYFDYGEALFQIAVVLASVAIITGTTLPLFGSAAAAVIATFMLINGFTMLVNLGLGG